jgi:hypothetical protein
MPSSTLVSRKSGFSFSTVFSTLNSRNRIAVLVSLIVLLAAWPAAAIRAKSATTTALTVTTTSGAVTSVPYGTTVTLTATVTPASSAITAGQVNFCDGGVAYCEDVHIIGTAQITSAGTATIKVHPLPGSYSYEAVFVGTKGFTGSTSGVSDLTVTGEYPTSTQVALAGTTGTFALTATVHGSARTGATPAGTVSFTDTTASNAVLGTAVLGGGTTSLLGDVTSGALRTMGPNMVVAGDFNGDGIQDLVVDEGASLAVLLGDGAGNFTQAQGGPIAITTGSDSPTEVLVADFNGDGIPDILVGVSQGIEILLGNGDGTFTQAKSSPVTFSGTSFYYEPDTGSGVTPIVVGDFNGDGIPDFAVLFGGTGLVAFLGNGDGTFQTPVVTNPGFAGNVASAVVGDFNGDGVADLVIQASYGPVFWLEGNGDGSFQSGVEVASGSSFGAGNAPVAIAAGDFNADGNLDLAIPYGKNVSILLGNGNGTFTAAASIPFTSPVNPSGGTEGVNRVYVGDFNGDGVPDLLLQGAPYGLNMSYGGPVNVALGNGNGTFTKSTATFPNVPYSYNSALADFNGDGLTDVVTSSEAGYLAQVLFANDAMATATNSNITAAGAASDLVVAQYPGSGNYLSSISTPIELIEAPTFNPPGGTYSSNEEVQISSGTPNTTIYYTLNGQTPQERAPAIEYAGQINVNISETINAIAYSADGSASAMSSATYVVPAPTPTITSLSPTGIDAMDADLGLTVTGTGYTSGSTVMWGSTALSTTYLSSTELSADIPAALLEGEGTGSLTVVTPAPGGGTSNAETFTVSALVPFVGSISPTSATAGSATFPLTVTGANFTSLSTIMWGSTALTTTYMGPTELTAQVPATLVATQGSASVTVVSPAPGGGTSGTETFTINAPPAAPTLGGISPMNITAGSATFPLTVTGTNFTSASTVMWGTTALATTFGSATSLTAQVTAGLLASEGTVSVTVVTPAPGGGTSGGSTFTINALVPTVGGISPTNITAGSATFPLTVTGTNFTGASTVMWRTTALATTFVSSVEVTAQVPAALVAEGGTASVSVVSPAPGGGTSGAETFTINGAALPTMSGISPALAVAGAVAFPLTVTGTNFTNASTVMWGSTALATTYGSPTSLTAQVTAAEVAAAGTLPVTVVTPAPGGGTSNTYVFEVDTAGTTPPTFGITTVTVTAGTASTASYTVTLPSTATDVSVTCLNLPTGATCSYSAGALTITTTALTPAGTYLITAVFNETLPGAASAVLLLPFLLLPFAGKQRRRKTGMMLAGLLVLAVAVLASGGCGGGGSGGGYMPPAPTTHTVSSSGAVTLVVH